MTHESLGKGLSWLLMLPARISAYACPSIQLSVLQVIRPNLYVLQVPSVCHGLKPHRRLLHMALAPLLRLEQVEAPANRGGVLGASRAA